MVEETHIQRRDYEGSLAQALNRGMEQSRQLSENLYRALEKKGGNYDGKRFRED